MAWFDVEAFDCCTCLYVYIASAVCDFLISTVWRKLTNKELALYTQQNIQVMLTAC